jgi:hypothetical protein
MKPIALTALALSLLLLAPSGEGVADVIRLRTGEVVKGRALQEASDVNVLAVEDYLTGSLRLLSWEALDPSARDRLQEEWGYKNKARSLVTGQVITMRLSDGDTEEVRGIIQRRDDAFYHVMTNGQLVKVDRSRVVGDPAEEPMDPRTIWTPEQLYDRFVEDMVADGATRGSFTSQQHFLLGQSSAWAENYERAREHFAAAAGDAEFLNRDVARQRLEGVEALLRDAAARDTLRDASIKLNMNAFSRVREILDGFAQKHPDAGEAVLQALERLRAKFVAERTKYFQREAGRSFTRIVENLIAEKVKEKDVEMQEVLGWTRRELPEKAFTALAERMTKRDPVSPEEARTFWEGRPKGGWRRVSYGDGTQFIEPPKVKPPKRRAASSAARQNAKGPAPKIDIPKPPTKDEWWAKADRGDRENFVFAYFAENSELFELGEREYKNCPTCVGTGLISKALSNGETLVYLCTRCGGAQQDILVKFR